MVGRYVKHGTNKEKLRKHGNTWQFWKGIREKGHALEHLPETGSTMCKEVKRCHFIFDDENVAAFDLRM